MRKDNASSGDRASSTTAYTIQSYKWNLTLAPPAGQIGGGFPSVVLSLPIEIRKNKTPSLAPPTQLK